MKRDRFLAAKARKARHDKWFDRTMIAMRRNHFGQHPERSCKRFFKRMGVEQ